MLYRSCCNVRFCWSAEFIRCHHPRDCMHASSRRCESNRHFTSIIFIYSVPGPSIHVWLASWSLTDTIDSERRSHWNARCDACPSNSIPVPLQDGFRPMAANGGTQDFFEGANHLELIAVCVLIISIALHSLLLAVQKATRRHRNLAQMLDRMFHELMILGLISTILYFMEKSSLFAHDELIRIHHIHLTLFFTVIGWVFTSVLLLATSIYISYTWTRSEQLIPQHNKLQRELEQIKKNLADVHVLLRPFYIGKWSRKTELDAFFDYYDVRQQFIDANHFPRTYNFGYYLRKCKHHVFLTLGGIHSSAWITVAFVLLVDMMYRNYAAKYSSVPQFMNSFNTYANGAIIFLSSAIAALSLIAHFKCKSILKLLQNSDMIKFDALANNYIIRVNFDDGVNDDLELNEESSLAEAIQPARVYHHDKWVHGRDRRDVIQGHAVVVSEFRYEYRPNRQQEMFWFGSHIVLLRFIQSMLAIMIITCSIMVSHYVAGGQVLYEWTPVIVIVLFIWVFISIASAIPVYTIIVHIGELADIKTAREAARKIEERRRSTLEEKRTAASAPKVSLGSRLERILISSWMESLIHWLIITNLLAVAIPLVFRSQDDIDFIGNVVTLSVTALFLMEVIIRGSILGFSYFLIDWWTIIDCIVVLASFLAAVAQFWLSFADIATVLLGMRLLESGRVWRIARKIKRARAMKQYQQEHPDPWDYSKDVPLESTQAPYAQDHGLESDSSESPHRHSVEPRDLISDDKNPQPHHDQRPSLFNYLPSNSEAVNGCGISPEPTTDSLESVAVQSRQQSSNGSV